MFSLPKLLATTAQTIAFLCLLCQPCFADIRGLPKVTILAASSVTDPLTEIIRIYSRQHNITVTASYNATSEQATKISNGDTANIFISSHPKWMIELKRKGLIDVFSLVNLVENKLDLVCSSKHHLKEQLSPESDIFNQLLHIHNKSTLVLGIPDETSLGSYTHDALNIIGNTYDYPLWNTIKNNTIRASSAKEVSYLIAHGNYCGIVFHSDTHLNNQITVLSHINDYSPMPITYQAAVVAGEHMEQARQFLDYLTSPEALSIFISHGFSPITK
tara:strand:- start:663 stop:1484 length:822 start_codon:yes stop_codon:yes gene_type:complete